MDVGKYSDRTVALWLLKYIGKTCLAREIQ